MTGERAVFRECDTMASRGHRWPDGEHTSLNNGCKGGRVRGSGRQRATQVRAGVSKEVGNLLKGTRWGDELEEAG